VAAKINLTTKTTERLQKEGIPKEYIANVEKFNFATKRRNDLYGFIDLLVLMPGIGTRAIQATGSTTGGAGEGWKRIRKIMGERTDLAKAWLQTPGHHCIEVWDWRKLQEKRGGKRKLWTPAIHQITLEDGVLVAYGDEDERYTEFEILEGA
jgi:hypothetical protein